jgi:hypothetical protein
MKTETLTLIAVAIDAGSIPEIKIPRPFTIFNDDETDETPNHGDWDTENEARGAAEFDGLNHYTIFGPDGFYEVH